MKKILIVLFMMFAISGCDNKKCECPKDEINSTEIYENIVTDYSKLYSNTVTSVVKIVVTKGSYLSTGSGVVFFEEGNSAYILTNAHVVKDVNSTYEVEVIFSNNEGFESGNSVLVDTSKIHKNTNEDIAVLEIERSNKYTVASIGDSDEISKGDFVYTIGSPFGRFNYTTSGYISSYNIPVVLNSSTVTSYIIVTTAVINEGNSGGALFDKDGNLIGLTTFRYDQINGKVAHEMYGCLAINHVVKVAKRILTGQTYTRPTINLNLLSVSEMGVNRSKYGISPTVTYGVYVLQNLESGINIAEGSSIITEVNGVKVRSVAEFQVEILKYDVGAAVTLTIITRDGLTSRTQTVTLHG